MLKFEVKNQIIKRVDEFETVADSKNYLTATFVFSDEWTGDIVAIFGHGGNYYNVLLENGMCDVPFEVIKPPLFTVSLFCGEDKLITSNSELVKVEKSGLVDGDAPETPTPTVFQQYMAEMQKLIDEFKETSGIDETVIENALKEYLSENPLEIPDETDPTIPEWAKQPTKPKYTAGEVGAYTKDETKAYVDNECEIIKSDMLSLNDKILSESHFRGYFLENGDFINLTATPNDFAYSAESGTKWIFTHSDSGAWKWIDTGIPVPDQLTPASDTLPLMNGTATSGIENAYARGDHRHPTDTTRLSVVEFDEFKFELETTLDDIIAKYGLGGDAS